MRRSLRWATAIRNGSTEAPIAAATPSPTGAMRITAVALFIQSDRSIVMTRTTATILHGGRDSPRSATSEAMRSAPPVVSKASPTGIIAPNRMMMGQFTA